MTQQKVASKRLSHTQKKTSTRRNLLILIGLLVTLYVIVPKLHGFHASFHEAIEARKDFLILALLASFSTYGFAAGTYWLLALHRLQYLRTLLIELANLLINRIVPGGVGGLGLNYEYLRTQHHSASQATTVVTVNNLLGLLGHVLLLLLLLGVAPMHVHFRFQAPHTTTWLLIGLVAVSSGVIGITNKRLRGKVLRLAQGFVKNVGSYRRHLGKLGFASASSISLTLANALSFWLCCLAVHVVIGFVAAFIVFSFSVLVGTATPTPGGLGGVEASLVAGLVAMGVESAPALAIVLVYRLLSYWLPLLIGSVAFIVVQKYRFVTTAR